MTDISITTDVLNISGGGGRDFLRIENKAAGFVCSLTPPVFNVNGEEAGGECLVFLAMGQECNLGGGRKEIRLEYSLGQGNNPRFFVIIRTFPGSPFIRYRLELIADKPVKLTKTNGVDRIAYPGVVIKTQKPELTEIQFSQFNPLVHSYNPNFERKSRNELEEGCKFPGPIALYEAPGESCLLAYEHGAEYPDSYLSFRAICGTFQDVTTCGSGSDIPSCGISREKSGSIAEKDSSLRIGIHAEKGNYYQGQVIDKAHPFRSPWFHFAITGRDSSELLEHYRSFWLRHACESPESRKPYIYYNTWNHQERDNYIHGRRYLDSMNAGRMLDEIETARRMGVDVFVIDTGWYDKTGDWTVSPERFPSGLADIKRVLDGYGMKLGLWFNPTVAAVSSEIVRMHPEFQTTVDGKTNSSKIWETEESFTMCLASGFSDYIIKKLVLLNRDLGVSYFKWDGISQYGCNSPMHHHGTQENTPEERHQCYSYQMGLEMIRIVEEVTRQCPGVIFDFDVTEGGRFVGLGFLSAGKYFLVNNGPYAMDFDLPEQFDAVTDGLAVNLNPWTNVFFFPGPARSRFCRQGVKYDFFVPSVLFLTHFLPDGPRLSQNNSLASLLLGGNGIWGDLPALSEEDIMFFRDALDKYKKVGEAVVASYPVIKGFVGSSPEIYEKISPEVGQGIVCFFTKAKGTFTHITRPLKQDRPVVVDGADSYELLAGGKIKLAVTLEENDARVVFVY